MKRYILTGFVALSLNALALPAHAGSGDSQSPAATQEAQQRDADRAAFLNAGLAGLKAGLNLTPDQEKLWPPFEAAIRDAAKSRKEKMKEAAAQMQGMHTMGADQDQSDASEEAAHSDNPADRLNAIAERMADHAAALKEVADATKPLFDSLDPGQKRLFGILGGDLLMSGHFHRMGMAMMMRHMGMRGGKDMMGHMGMGAMMQDRMEGAQPEEDEHDQDERDHQDDD